MSRRCNCPSLRFGADFPTASRVDRSIALASLLLSAADEPLSGCCGFTVARAPEPAGKGAAEPVGCADRELAATSAEVEARPSGSTRVAGAGSACTMAGSTRGVGAAAEATGCEGCCSPRLMQRRHKPGDAVPGGSERLQREHDIRTSVCVVVVAHTWTVQVTPQVRLIS